MSKKINKENVSTPLPHREGSGVSFLLNAWKIRREERLLALMAFVMMTALNALMICRYFEQFIKLTDNYHRFFVQHFMVSGYDPLTYAAVSDWDTEYNVYRHPLLAFFMYIPYLINKGLMLLLGINLVQFIVAAILVFCAFYSFLFLYRIIHEVIGAKRWDAALLSTFFFSFAYVMVAVFVPDHFIMSTMMLLLTLYICGIKQNNKEQMTIGETVVLFFLTAGISLNNGIKTYLAALFTNGKHLFRWKFLLLAIIIPCALIWVGARMEYRHYVWPKEMARAEQKKKVTEQHRQQIYKQYKDTAQTMDSAKIEADVKQIIKQKAREKYKRDHQKIWNKNTGKPMADGEFMRWTDKTTSRWTTAVENLFGESIQLHQDYLLGDVLRNRPVFVEYRWAINYVVEGLIVLLFLLGIFCGCRSRFLWTAMSFFLFDMVLHMGLGFGINEIYIMAPHWIFILPIAIGYLFVRLKRRLLPYLRVLVCLLTLFLLIWNITLVVTYMVN